MIFWLACSTGAFYREVLNLQQHIFREGKNKQYGRNFIVIHGSSKSAAPIQAPALLRRYRVLSRSGLLYPGALLAQPTRLHPCHAVPGVRTGVALGSTEHLLFLCCRKAFPHCWSPCIPPRLDRSWIHLCCTEIRDPGCCVAPSS